MRLRTSRHKGRYEYQCHGNIETMPRENLKDWEEDI